MPSQSHVHIGPLETSLEERPADEMLIHTDHWSRPGPKNHEGKEQKSLIVSLLGIGVHAASTWVPEFKMFSVSRSIFLLLSKPKGAVRLPLKRTTVTDAR